MRTTRKRRAGFVQVGPTNPSVDEMVTAQGGQSGLFMLRFEHDRSCKTIRSQRWEDCTCRDVDHRLLRFVPEGGHR